MPLSKQQKGQTSNPDWSTNLTRWVHATESSWDGFQDMKVLKATKNELARLGSETHPVGPEPFIPISQGLQDKAIQDYLFSVHLKRYRNNALSDKGKVPAEAYLRKHKYSNFNTRGSEIRWITWLLTGHSPQAFFQQKANNNQVESSDFEV